MDHLCAFSLRKFSEFSSLAGIYSFDEWFTETHKEIRGHNSIAAMPFRKNLLIHAAGITVSRRLLKTAIDFLQLWHWRHKGCQKLGEGSRSFVFRNQLASLRSLHLGRTLY